MATDSLTATKIQVWKILHEGLEPELPNLPIITERHSEFGSMIMEAENLQFEQKGLLSALRVLNQRRRELALAGEEMRLRLAAFLQGEHGFQNEKLIGFGVKPRKRTRRTRKPVEPDPEAPEAPQEQPSNE